MTKLKVKTTIIAGYKFRELQFPTGYISFGAPTGDNAFEKQMFDTLVYYKRRLYNGKTENRKVIIRDIEQWIKEYTDKNLAVIL